MAGHTTLQMVEKYQVFDAARDDKRAERMSALLP